MVAPGASVDRSRSVATFGSQHSPFREGPSARVRVRGGAAAGPPLVQGCTAVLDLQQVHEASLVLRKVAKLRRSECTLLL